MFLTFIFFFSPPGVRRCQEGFRFTDFVTQVVEYLHVGRLFYSIGVLVWAQRTVGYLSDSELFIRAELFYLLLIQRLLQKHFASGI
jgi:hypothetical protein